MLSLRVRDIGDRKMLHAFENVDRKFLPDRRYYGQAATDHALPSAGKLIRRECHLRH